MSKSNIPFFVEAYAAQVLWRRIFLSTGFLFFLGMMFFAVLWLITPMPKTEEDYLRSYIYSRFNYDHNTARQAFFNDLQYMPIAYSQLMAPELRHIENQKIYHKFRIEKITKERGIYIVEGHRLVISLIADTPPNILHNGPAVLHIGVRNGKFFQTESPS